jgi:hypothetical protein
MKRKEQIHIKPNQTSRIPEKKKKTKNKNKNKKIKKIKKKN